MSATAMHPLQQTFERAADLAAPVSARVGPRAGQDWITPTALFAEGSSDMARLIDRERQRLRTSTPNVIGSALFQNYQWPVIGAATAAYLVDRRVPDVTPDNVQVRFSPSGYAEAIAFREGRFLALANDPEAGHPGATLVPDRAALRDQVRVGLEAHLGWAIEQICRGVGCRSRGLWLAAADRCTSSVAWLMQAQDSGVTLAQVTAEVEPLIRVPGSPLWTLKVGLIEVTSGGRSEVFLKRATCCYWYRAEGGGYCSTCPGRPAAQRIEHLRKSIADKKACVGAI